jgi:hypothetical protein
MAVAAVAAVVVEEEALAAVGVKRDLKRLDHRM